MMIGGERLVAVNISGELWQAVMTEGHCIGGPNDMVKTVKGLPEGAKFRGAIYDDGMAYDSVSNLAFVFEHPSFDVVQAGMNIPRLDVEFISIRCDD